MKTKWKITIGVGLALLATGAGLAAFIIHSSIEVVRDSYAQWDAALSIICHMKTHDEAWPKDWEALHEACLSAPDLRGPGWDNLIERVDVDFSADPHQLSQAEFRREVPPFRVVWLRNGKKHHWSGAEPNGLILEYLKNRSAEQRTGE
ncbi:MAG: hypothetical protein WC381_01935 [Kiritimatiellia bacterium]|jgi:hypothetical protein